MFVWNHFLVKFIEADLQYYFCFRPVDGACTNGACHGFDDLSGSVTGVSKITIEQDGKGGDVLHVTDGTVEVLQVSGEIATGKQDAVGQVVDLLIELIRIRGLFHQRAKDKHAVTACLRAAHGGDQTQFVKFGLRVAQIWQGVDECQSLFVFSSQHIVVAVALFPCQCFIGGAVIFSKQIETFPDNDQLFDELIRIIVVI